MANSEVRATSYISMPTSTNLDMMDDDALSDNISLPEDNKLTEEVPIDGVKRSETAAIAVSLYFRIYYISILHFLSSLAQTQTVILPNLSVLTP